MAKSQNGYPVLLSADECAKWSIPVRRGEARHVFLRKGHVGYVLACFILWFHRSIERVNKGQWDEWGWAYRPIRGETDVYSNHASATAVDINAVQHPLGVRNTFYPDQAKKIRRRLKLWRNVIRWGGDYQSRADEMHFEADKGFAEFRRLAFWIRLTPVGIAVLKANPHYRPRWRKEVLNR